MRLNWLHISDIHFYKGTEWRDSVARNALIQEIIQTLKDNPQLRPDLVFCTGDIAFGETGASPLVDQYVAARSFFNELLAACGPEKSPLSIDRLFMVPGNHDVNRQRINKDAQTSLTFKSKDSHAHADEINQRIDRVTTEFDEALTRLDEYQNFISDFAPHLATDKRRCRVSKIVEINKCRVGIYGFNSAWSCSGDEDDRNLWLPAAWNFNRALGELDGADVKIGLMHHPIDWLVAADRKIAKQRVATDFDFWLHGHEHDAWVHASDSVVTMSAGAVGANDSSEFGFQLVSLNLSKGQGTTRIFGFKKNGTKWTPLSLDKIAPAGVMEFRLPNRLVSTGTPLNGKASQASGVKPRFLCAQIEENSILRFTGIEIPYHRISDLIEDEFSSLSVSNCVIWLPNIDTLLRPPKYSAIVAVCLESIEAASDLLREVVEVNRFDTTPSSPRRLSDFEHDRIFDAVCRAFDNAFVAAIAIPASMVQVKSNDWMVSFDVMSSLIFPPLVQLHESCGFRSVNYILNPNPEVGAKLVERISRTIRASSPDGSTSPSIRFATGDDQLMRLVFGARCIAWALRIALNQNDRRRLDQLMEALGGAARA